MGAGVRVLWVLKFNLFQLPGSQTRDKAKNSNVFDESWETAVTLSVMVTVSLSVSVHLLVY